MALSPKAFELLLALLAARPRALSRAELHDRLWPGTFVSHYSLPRVVAEVREPSATVASGAIPAHRARLRLFVLRRGASARGRGLSAVCRPRCPASPSSGKRETLPLAPGETLIGRDPECAVRIDLPLISRRHARIRIAGDVATMEDLGSKNGTSLAGQAGVPCPHSSTTARRSWWARKCWSFETGARCDRLGRGRCACEAAGGSGLPSRGRT